MDHLRRGKGEGFINLARSFPQSLLFLHIPQSADGIGTPNDSRSTDFRATNFQLKVNLHTSINFFVRSSWTNGLNSTELW